MKFWNSK